jgi:hypothetical protein
VALQIRNTQAALMPNRAFLAMLSLLLVVPHRASAQPFEPDPAPVVDDEPWPSFERVRVALLVGLIQPILLRGGNVEVDLYYGRLVVGYSHGFLLQLQGDTVVGDAADQGLAFTLPYSTGSSVGYRFLEWLDARLEGKVHRFEVRDEATDQHLFAYTTVTFGFGVYAQYRPFYDFGLSSGFDEWLHGFMVLGSARFWPNVWTSLSRDQRAYESPTTGQEALHRAANIGIANTPLVLNLSVGYSVTF